MKKIYKPFFESKQLSESSKLTDTQKMLIKQTMRHVGLPGKFFNQLCKDVESDYADSDLNELTQDDIVEIIDASEYADEME